MPKQKLSTITADLVVLLVGSLLAAPFLLILVAPFIGGS